MATRIPMPEAVPKVHHVFNEYLVFDLNAPAIHAGLYFLYYLMLEPVAAVRSYLSDSIAAVSCILIDPRSSTPLNWHSPSSPPTHLPNMRAESPRLLSST